MPCKIELLIIKLFFTSINDKFELDMEVIRYVFVLGAFICMLDCRMKSFKVEFYMLLLSKLTILLVLILTYILPVIVTFCRVQLIISVAINPELLKLEIKEFIDILRFLNVVLTAVPHKIDN